VDSIVKITASLCNFLIYIPFRCIFIHIGHSISLSFMNKNHHADVLVENADDWVT
jgi:hypothetical protein